MRRPDHWPQAAGAGRAGGRRASRASWTGPGTAGSCISFRPPTLPEEMEGGGRGLVRGGMRGGAFSPTLIRAAGGTCGRGPVASTPADALLKPASEHCSSLMQSCASGAVRAELCALSCARGAVRAERGSRSGARGVVRAERCARSGARRGVRGSH
jgi:hypothetical protein